MKKTLKEEIMRARRFNSYGSILLILLIVFGIWLYKFSGLEVPMVVNVVIMGVFGFFAFTIPQKLDDVCIAKCPKCSNEVEKGGLLGQKLPSSCTKCGLQVSGL